MASFSRLLSHPAIVGLLQTGAGFTTQMQKDREEEERLRRELAMTTFERQMQNLDRDKARAQQLADLADTRAYNEKQQAAQDAREDKSIQENRYYNLLGSNDPALVEASQDIAIDQGDADKLALATSRYVDVQKQQKRQAFDQEITRVKTELTMPSEEAKYWARREKEYQERGEFDFAAEAGAMAENAKKSQRLLDESKAKTTEDETSRRKVFSYVWDNPNANPTQMREWASGAKLSSAGSEMVLRFISEKNSGAENIDKIAHLIGMEAVRATLKSKADAAGISFSTEQMDGLTQTQGAGGDVLGATLATAGGMGIDTSGISETYWNTVNDFKRRSAGGGGSGGGQGGGGSVPEATIQQAMREFGISHEEAERRLLAADKQPPLPPRQSGSGKAGTVADAPPQPPGISAAVAEPLRRPPSPFPMGQSQVGFAVPSTGKPFQSPAESGSAALERQQSGLAQQKAARNMGIMKEMNDRMGKGEDPAAVIQAMMLQYPDMTREEIMGLVAAPYRQGASSPLKVTIPTVR